MAATREDVREAVVEAAALVLKEQGAAGLTTRAVAQLAGVQAPTLYRLFGDKDGLVEAVAEHVMATYVASKAEGAADGDPVADLRAAWRRHVEFGLANPDLYSLLAARARSGSSPATEAGIEVLRTRVHRLATAGLLRVSEHRAVMMIHASGTGTVLALLGAATQDRDPELAESVLDAVMDGILATAPAAADTSVTGIAVTFAAVVPDLPGLSEAERALMAEWLTRALDAPRAT